MKKLTSLFVAISVMTSMSLSGFDMESIANLFHILRHQHGVTNAHHDSQHHHHSSKDYASHENEHGESRPIEKSESLKVTHQHSDGDGHSGEPHEHSINFSGSTIVFVKEAFQAYVVMVVEIQYSPPYTQNRVYGPDFDGLFRPPKC
ncbi:MAG: hypothetical protein KDD35_08880 [Bdellovibrionales bacterium]|nr:hypothetical protein [Bdellovibrionales bacterium]